LGFDFQYYEEGSGRFRTSVAWESARTIADLAGKAIPTSPWQKSPGKESRKNPRLSAESPGSSDRLDLESVSVSIGERLNLATDFDYGMSNCLHAESSIRACEKLAFQDAGVIADRHELHDSTIHLMMQPVFDDHPCEGDASKVDL
jgi:hypothetical protein